MIKTDSTMTRVKRFYRTLFCLTGLGFLAMLTQCMPASSKKVMGPFSDLVPVTLNVESLFPGSDWNDYAQGSFEGTYFVPKAACVTQAGAEPTQESLEACVHLGERRKVLLPPAYLSCEGWTFFEELEAFDWACRDHEGHGPVEFYSTGLKAKKGLQDLVEDRHWKNNRVLATNDGVTLQSAKTPWWRNPVMDLPFNEGTHAIALNQVGAVYVLNESRTSGSLRVLADKISLVVRRKSVLTGTAETLDKCSLSVEKPVSGQPFEKCLLETAGRKFLWIEGVLTGAPLGTLDESQLKQRFLLVRRLNKK